MTREEAINELKYAQAMCMFDPSTGEVRFRNEEDKLQHEAFGMAIEALSAQKTGHWIGGELGNCSVCGHYGCASDIWDRCNSMYCPSCGAYLGENK